MARPSRTALYAHDRTYLWKFLLRVLAILFAGVAIGTIAWATTVRYNDNNNNGNVVTDSDGDTYLDDDYTDFYSTFTILLPWVIIALGLSFIWNIINIIILLARNRWIHPGANVGCDLVLWLVLGISGGIAATGAGSYLLYGWEYDDGGYDDNSGGYLTYPNGTNYYVPTNGTDGGNCGDASCGNNNNNNNIFQHASIVVIIGCAFAYIVMLFHFALFISACRYTHSRRHSKYSAHHTRAVTEEATQIARRMIAEMTSPNGAFLPINNQNHQQQQQQPLLQPDQFQNRSDSDPAMQRQPNNQVNDNQPMQQRYEPPAPSTNTTQRWPIPPPPPPEISVDSPTSETSNVAERWAVPPPPEVSTRNPVAEEVDTHPALRRQQQRDEISPV